MVCGELWGMWSAVDRVKERRSRKEVLSGREVEELSEEELEKNGVMKGS